MASSMSLVSLPSMVKIHLFLKSFLPSISSSVTWSLMVFNCSKASSGKSLKKPCWAAMVDISISGSSLWPMILSIWPSKTALFSIVAILSFPIFISTLWPVTICFNSSFGHITVTFPWMVYGINSPSPAYSKTVFPLALLIIFSTDASA